MPQLALFDALPDALFLVRDDAIVWASDAAGRMLRIEPARLSGVPLASVLATGERERLRVLEGQRRTGWHVPDTCRMRFVRADATEVTSDLRFGHPPDGHDTLLLAARDVTEVTRAERLMGTLAELSSEIVALDADALLDASEPVFVELGWRGALTEVFEGGSITRRVLAAPPGDPLGDYVRTIVGRKMPLERTPIVAEVMRTGRAIFLDNVPAFLSGPASSAVELSESMSRARLTRSAWCPVRVGGRTTHVLALSGKDLTEHDFVAIQLFAAQIGAAIQTTQLRAELVRRERLAAVGEMAAVLAHEVRNPLAVIFNALGGLQKIPQPDEDAVALLGILGEESERLRRLVSDLLDFARPPTPQLGEVDVAKVLEQALDAARQDPTCDASRARCELRVPPDLPRAEADAFLLRRVLLNLVVNALQHVPPGGRVTISAEPSGPSELCITVDNDGPPIAPELAPRIFEPFFTTQASGTGLGLAIVRRVVEDLRGRIDVVPREGGVSFVIALAASREP